jgi:hypothetical protein
LAVSELILLHDAATDGVGHAAFGTADNAARDGHPDRRIVAYPGVDHR